MWSNAKCLASKMFCDAKLCPNVLFKSCFSHMLHKTIRLFFAWRKYVETKESENQNLKYAHYCNRSIGSRRYREVEFCERYRAYLHVAFHTVHPYPGAQVKFYSVPNISYPRCCCMRDMIPEDWYLCLLYTPYHHYLLRSASPVMQRECFAGGLIPVLTWVLYALSIV